MTKATDDKKLDDVLLKLQVPDENQNTKEQQIDHALTFMGAENLKTPQSFNVKRYAVFGSLLLVCVLSYLAFFNQDTAHNAPTPVQTAGIVYKQDVLKYRQLFQEIEETLNNQFAAIIVDENNEIEIIESEYAAAVDATPVLVTVQNGAAQYNIISYSGQRVSLPVNGHSVGVDVLVTGKGNVILASENLFSVTSDPYAARYSKYKSLITATVMERV